MEQIKSEVFVKLIIDSISNNQTEKTYVLVLNYFDRIESFEIVQQYWMRDDSLIACILESLRYVECDIDALLDKILSNPFITKKEINLLLVENYNLYKTSKLIQLVENYKDVIDIKEYSEIVVSNNRTILYKHLIGFFKIDPTKNNNYDLHSFAGSSNIKMVRFLAKRKDVQEVEKKTEEEIIREYAY